MSDDPNDIHPKYRPDIDGLRALAIGLVVAFHTFPGKFPGGFIGVDIFFVISGFLISSIIFKGLERGIFSFSDFYARRIRRIFPALLLVLIFCLGTGFFVMLADEYKQLGRHVMAGAVFLSNFALLGETGYFDTNSKGKVLLHLWSLGIEEQFYIVWPLLLWLVWKRKLNLLFIIVSLIVVSLASDIALYQSGYRDKAFYLPVTRFWELLLGNLLAYAALYRPSMLEVLQRKIFGLRLADISSIAGVALIGIAFVLIREEKSALWLLLPTSGAFLIIAAGRQAIFNRFILANRVSVGLGMISYPFYLWHWPFLSFDWLIESENPDRFIKIPALLVSFAFACLTYVLIERPIRMGAYGQKLTPFLIAAMIAVFGIGLAVYESDGRNFVNAQMSGDIRQMVLDVVTPNATRLSDGSCEKLLGIKDARSEVCLTSSATPDIMIIGDSHATSLNAAAHLKMTDLNTVLVAAHGCLPFLGYRVAPLKKDSKETNCLGIAPKMFEMAEKVPSIKTVIILTRGPYYLLHGSGFGTEDKSDAVLRSGKTGKIVDINKIFVDGYTDTIQRLRKLGKKVVFVIDYPELGMDAKFCVEARPFTFGKKPAVLSCVNPRSAVDARQKFYREKIAAIQRRNPGLLVYDTLPVFCSDTECTGKDDRHIFYHDDDHLSNSGSKMLLDKIVAWLALN